MKNIHCKNDSSIKKLHMKKIKQINVDGPYADGRGFLIFTDIFEKDLQICAIHSSYASHSAIYFIKL